MGQVNNSIKRDIYLLPTTSCVWCFTEFEDLIDMVICFKTKPEVIYFKRIPSTYKIFGFSNCQKAVVETFLITHSPN